MSKEILVVKYGSKTVATSENGVDRVKIESHVDQLVSVSKNYRLVVVSSGAVRSGEHLWHQLHPGEALPSLQSLAMLGSSIIHSAWQVEFAKQGVAAGQLLATHREIDDASEQPVLLAAIRDNHEHDIIPIANENDALSVEELAKLSYGGDNDGFAAHLAMIAGASALILMNNRGGFIDDGGIELPTIYAEQYDEVLKVARNRDRKKDPLSAGRGGLESKLTAGIVAARAGISGYLGSTESNLKDILDGRGGTCLPAVAPIERFM